MIVRFILPNDQAEKINGFLGGQVQKMRLYPESMAGEGKGAILEADGKLFTREKFRAGRNHFGAVLVGANKWKICEALNVPIDETGILEGYTETEYAKSVRKSRQYISQAIKAGKIPAVKIGKTWIVTERPLTEDEKEALRAAGQAVAE